MGVASGELEPFLPSLRKYFGKRQAFDPVHFITAGRRDFRRCVFPGFFHGASIRKALAHYLAASSEGRMICVNTTRTIDVTFGPRKSNDFCFIDGRSEPDLLESDVNCYCYISVGGELAMYSHYDQYVVVKENILCPKFFDVIPDKLADINSQLAAELWPDMDAANELAALRNIYSAQ